MIKFVSDLGHVSGFFRVLGFLPTNKTDRHDITEILLKVALNIIKHLNQPLYELMQFFFAEYRVKAVT